MGRPRPRVLGSVSARTAPSFSLGPGAEADVSKAARLGGNKSGHFEGLDKSAVPTNYFGRNFRSVDAFGRLRQTGVYPGIDIVYYGKGQTLEYDFELAPGADPSRIRMRFEGADTIHLGPQGQVILEIGRPRRSRRIRLSFISKARRRNRRRALLLRDGSGRLHRHSLWAPMTRAGRWWSIPPSCSPATWPEPAPMCPSVSATIRMD